MSPAAKTTDDDSTREVHKHYNISLVINLKRGKDEIDFANKETERLHNLIASDVQPEWAKTQISTIHKMIFMPDTDQIKTQLEEKLSKED